MTHSYISLYLWLDMYDTHHTFYSSNIIKYLQNVPYKNKKTPICIGVIFSKLTLTK